MRLQVQKSRRVVTEKKNCDLSSLSSSSVLHSKLLFFKAELFSNKTTTEGPYSHNNPTNNVLLISSEWVPKSLPPPTNFSEVKFRPKFCFKKCPTEGTIRCGTWTKTWARCRLILSFRFASPPLVGWGCRLKLSFFHPASPPLVGWGCRLILSFFHPASPPLVGWGCRLILSFFRFASPPLWVGDATNP